MRYFLAILTGSCLAVAIFSAGCRHDAPTESLSIAGTSLVRDSPRSDSLALMRSVARALAVALSDTNIRADVHAALLRSTAREGKLHLQRFLRARGSDLGRAIGRKSSIGESDWTQVVLQLADLELYMPIPAQRAKWRGTSDILVAGFMETDEEIQQAGDKVTAYRTDGSSVQLSYNAEPDQPVIVIYPVESKFGRDGESPDATASVQAPEGGDNIIFPPGPVPVPSACASNNPNGANLYLCHTSFPDHGQYEEFLRGAPEFAMQIFSFAPPPPGHLVDPATRRQIACINEDLTGSKFYNQDSDNWDGKALLLSRAALQAEQNTGRRTIMVVWEDDNGSKCDLNPEGNQVAPWGTLHGLSTVTGLIGIGTGGLGGWALASISGVVNGLAWMFGTSGDDIVGSVVIPSTSAPLTNPKELRPEANRLGGKITFMTQ
jgi:hypothetical protein